MFFRGVFLISALLLSSHCPIWAQKLAGNMNIQSEEISRKVKLASTIGRIESDIVGALEEAFAS